MRAWCSGCRLRLFQHHQWRNLSDFRRPRKQARRVPSNEELLASLNHIRPDTKSALTAQTRTADSPSKDNATDSSSIPASQLPQSPLTDPKLNAARFGHKQAKPLPNHRKLSGFQLKLQKNPYGNVNSNLQNGEIALTNPHSSPRSCNPSPPLYPHRRPPTPTLPPRFRPCHPPRNRSKMASTPSRNRNGRKG